MGTFNTIAQPQQQPAGKGGGAQGQQPQFGQPNQYSNTVGQQGGWDNATIQPQQQSVGKGGKGQSWKPYQSPTSWNSTTPATSVANPVANDFPMISANSDFNAGH